jgi:hypothetical protein
MLDSCCALSDATGARSNMWNPLLCQQQKGQARVLHMAHKQRLTAALLLRRHGVPASSSATRSGRAG